MQIRGRRLGPLLLLASILLLACGVGTAGGKETKPAAPKASAGTLKTCIGRDRVLRARSRCLRGERSVTLTTPGRGARRAGDITAVTAGTGLEGGGQSGAVGVSLARGYQLPQGCGADDYAQWWGHLNAWACTTLVAREPNIAPSAVTTTKIADAAVTVGKIADAAVTPAKISTPARLPQGCSNGQYPGWWGLMSEWQCTTLLVGEQQIAPGAVTTPKIADEAVTGPKLDFRWRVPRYLDCATAYVIQSSGQNAAAGGTGWVCGPVGTQGIADGAVTTPKIADGSVVKGKLANESVNTSKLADSAVTAPKLDESVRLPICPGPNASVVARNPDSSQWYCMRVIAADSNGCAGPPSQEVLTLKVNRTELRCVPDSVVDAGVTTAKLAPDAVTPPKLAPNVRLPQGCGGGEVAKWAQTGGPWVCAGDENTTYQAGFGLLLDGTEFNVADHVIQVRVEDECGFGSSIRTISEDGAVTCEADDNTTYSGESPIEIAGTTVGFSTAGCDSNDVWKYTGTYWSCDADAGTTYTGGPGIDVSGSTIQLSNTGCMAGEIWKYNGTTWTCEEDRDQDARLPTCDAGDMTRSNGPGYSCTEGLPDTPTCDAGDVIEWTGTAGWTCDKVAGSNVEPPFVVDWGHATDATVQGVNNDTGPGVNGTGTRVGVTGTATGPNGTGVDGTGGSVGMFGTGVNFGVVGEGATGGFFRSTNPGGYAGHFSGNVLVNGTVTVNGDLIVSGTKSFRIPHPLEPERKWLRHAAVESPDMKTVYDGNITTNARGYAVVRLPAYFQALNRDYRYQLTVIRSFAQAVVWREIRDNRFTIRTSKPHVKVSWQVTGIRQDAYARAHPMQVETPR